MLRRMVRTSLMAFTATVVIEILNGFAAAPASAVTLTATIEPTSVANGGIVTVSGTAPCSQVIIDAHPGVLGIRSVGSLAGEVTHGRYSTTIHLPAFAPDPSRPGVNAVQNFEVVCPGTRAPVATATLAVTGIELPRTGGQTVDLSVAAPALIFAGTALVLVARRRSAATSRPTRISAVRCSQG